MRKLEQYYEDDESWNKFSLVFVDDWVNSDFQKLLLNQLNNRVDLAKVIYYHLGKSSLDWLNKEIDILDGLTPIECLKNKNTENRLRQCLMRMH